MNILEPRFLNSETDLRNFSIISYLVDPIKLKLILGSEYEPILINLGNVSYGLVSAVSFLDTNFKFSHAPKLPGDNFWQTNYRAYVYNESTGENLVWFFRTTLGSNIVKLPRLLWKMPWNYGFYSAHIMENSWRLDCESTGANLKIDIKCIDEEKELVGFNSTDEAILILTDPQNGRYRRTDGKIGGYKIWHEKMKIKHAIASDLFFELFENLGLVKGNSFLKPHSILVTESIHFKIQLPPKVEI